MLARFFVGRVSRRRNPTWADAVQAWLAGRDQDSGMPGYALWANATYEKQNWRKFRPRSGSNFSVLQHSKGCADDMATTDGKKGGFSCGRAGGGCFGLSVL